MPDGFHTKWLSTRRGQTHTHTNKCPAGCVTASAALEKQEERVFITSSGREAGLQRGVCLLILCQLQQLQIVNPELAKVVLLSVFVLVCLAYKRPRFLFCQQIRKNSIPCFGTHCVMEAELCAYGVCAHTCGLSSSPHPHCSCSLQISSSDADRKCRTNGLFMF